MNQTAAASGPVYAVAQMNPHAADRPRLPRHRWRSLATTASIPRPMKYSRNSSTGMATSIASQTPTTRTSAARSSQISSPPEDPPEGKLLHQIPPDSSCFRDLSLSDENQPENQFRGAPRAWSSATRRPL